MSVWAVIQFGLAVLSPAGDPKPPPPPTPTPNVALASWYFDAGQTASGRHYTYGFASLMFGSEWGLPIRFRHGANTVTATMSDHGPYIAGRTFDLNAALKAALGCSDLCTVRWGYAR